MDKYYTDKTFLARWVANELTEEERSEFEKTDAYRYFDKLNKEALLLEGPVIDTELALKKVQSQLHSSKSIRMKRRIWKYGIAACFAVAIALVGYLNTSITYSTGNGEKQTIALSDGSVVYLNANSSLSRNRIFWSDHRQVALQGEAYFEITKGKDFEVKTTKGTITVLGTRFNVHDRGNFEISCYEGRIRFKTALDTNQTTILNKGMLLTLEQDKIQTKIFEGEIPSWRAERSKFNDQPLSKVLIELENQYQIKFQSNNVDTDRLYTGEFVHNNLKMALEATLTPMGIKYSSPDQPIIILSN